MEVRGDLGGHSSIMRNRINFFVAFVALAALMSGLQLFAVAPDIPAGSGTPLLLLGGLAIVAEFLAYALSGSASGSIAFIPYLASVLIVPSWVSLAVTTGIKVLLHSARRTSGVKAIFNIGLHALTFSVAVLVYRWLGGVSLTQFNSQTLLRTSAAVGLPAMIAFFASFIANSLFVSGVVAIS